MLDVMSASKDIVDEAIEALRSTGVPASQMAKDAGVQESWLRMFMRAKIPNPGVRQFELVRSYLRKRRQPEGAKAA